MATNPYTTLDGQTYTDEPKVLPGLVSAPVPTPAAQWDVKPEQTVQSQIKGIIDENSPLMQQAKTKSLQEANQRGLMNTTMAVTAGQDAVYRAAAPIAQQDAATYARSGEFNVGQKNQFGLQSNEQQNALQKMAQTQGYNLQTMNQQQINEMVKLDTNIQATAARDATAIQADTARATALAQTNTASATALAAAAASRDTVAIEANKAAALFTSNVGLEMAAVNRANEALLRKSGNAVNAQSAYALALNNIAMSTLEPAAKTAAQANAFKAYKNALSLISSVDNVADLSTLVSFG